MEDHDTANGEVGDEAVDSSNPLVPPHWSHRRYESYCSVGNTKPPPITLEDHTEEPSLVSNSAWARGVTIDDHVIVTGSVPNVGKFVVWNCRIDTLDVSEILLLNKLRTVMMKRLNPSRYCHRVPSHTLSCSLRGYTDTLQGGSIIIRKRSVPAALDQYLKC